MELKDLLNDRDAKIVLLVFDGLGGVPFQGEGKTELEAARIPNLDDLARRSSLGLMVMVDHGIAPGSGPGHFALFGYDPVRTEVGRGVLEALGVGRRLEQDELAARGNFATLDRETGLLTDRRGGPPTQERNHQLVALLNERVEAPEGCSVEFISGKEHRLVFILKGPSLVEGLTETDPQVTGVSPPKVEPLVPEAARTAELVNTIIARINHVLAEHYPQNTVLLRGFAKAPRVEPFGERYGLNAAAIATYPMYRGIASLVGMDVLETGPTFADQVETLEQAFDSYDFFFVHVKGTDSAGHRGDFWGKVKVLEECDSLLPRIQDLRPDVVVVTGDHSTPAAWKDHSFHPVPVLIHASTAQPTGQRGFTEVECARGILGTFEGRKLMNLVLAYAGRLKKFGA